MKVILSVNCLFFTILVLFKTVELNGDCNSINALKTAALAKPSTGMREMTIHEINDDVKSGCEVVDEVLSIIDEMHLKTVGKLVGPMRKLVNILPTVFNIVAKFLPNKDKPSEVAEIKKQFDELNKKIDRLETKVDEFPYQVELALFRNQILKFKESINKISSRYSIYYGVISQNYSELYDQAVSKALNDLSDTCNKWCQDSLSDMYTDMQQVNLKTMVVGPLHWDLRDIDYMAQDFFTTLVTFSTFQTICLGIKSNQLYTDVVNNYTSCTIDYMVNQFVEIEAIVQNEFYLGDRLRTEIGAEADKWQDMDKMAEAVNSFLSTKYDFVTWYVHVYQQCDASQHAFSSVHGIGPHIGYNILSTDKLNIAYSWTDRALESSKGCNINPPDYTFSDAQTCIAYLINVIENECGPGFASAIHYVSARYKGFIVYDEHVYQAWQTSKWIGAMSTR